MFFVKAPNICKYLNFLGNLLLLYNYLVIIKAIVLLIVIYYFLLSQGCFRASHKYFVYLQVLYVVILFKFQVKVKTEF